MMRDHVDPASLRDIAVRIAGEVAALLRDYSCYDPFAVRTQGETLVADKVSEDYIIDALRREGLRAVGVSEERGFFRINDGGELRIVIDPLDGSTNYSLCIPWASVSLAFAYGNRLRDVVAGAVVPIFHGNPFSFAISEGCFYGGERVRLEKLKKSSIDKVVIAYFDEERYEALLSTVSVLKRELGSLKVRSLGSSALELCYVALGRFLAFIDVRNRLRNVDVAAALGFLRSLGGEAFDLRGNPVDAALDSVVNLEGVVASLDPQLALRLARMVA